MAYITINRQNFYHNLNQIALKTGSKEKIAIVLKDNAYGHGLKLIATLASEYGIKHAVVRDLTEAEEVKELFESVLVLAGESRVDAICSFAINSERRKAWRCVQVPTDQSFLSHAVSERGIQGPSRTCHVLEGAAGC